MDSVQVSETLSATETEEGSVPVGFVLVRKEKQIGKVR